MRLITECLVLFVKFFLLFSYGGILRVMLHNILLFMVESDSHVWILEQRE